MLVPNLIIQEILQSCNVGASKLDPVQFDNIYNFFADLPVSSIASHCKFFLLKDSIYLQITFSGDEVHSLYALDNLSFADPLTYLHDKLLHWLNYAMNLQVLPFQLTSDVVNIILVSPNNGLPFL